MQTSVTKKASDTIRKMLIRGSIIARGDSLTNIQNMDAKCHAQQTLFEKKQDKIIKESDKTKKCVR